MTYSDWVMTGSITTGWRHREPRLSVGSQQVGNWAGSLYPSCCAKICNRARSP
jgi:hypothetical protein